MKKLIIVIIMLGFLFGGTITKKYTEEGVYYFDTGTGVSYLLSQNILVGSDGSQYVFLDDGSIVTNTKVNYRRVKGGIVGDDGSSCKINDGVVLHNNGDVGLDFGDKYIYTDTPSK